MFALQERLQITVDARIPSERMMGAHQPGGHAVTAIHDHIRSLEGYVARSGARLVRDPFAGVGTWASMQRSHYAAAGLSPEQELLTLVHELAHWLAHREACPGLHCTVFEYEAEAVEALVMARLGLAPLGLDVVDIDRPTDGLLSASVSASDLGERSYLWCAWPGDRAAALRAATPRPRRGSGR